MSQLSTAEVVPVRYAEGESQASKETRSVGAEEDNVSKYSFSEIARRLSAAERVAQLLSAQEVEAATPAKSSLRTVVLRKARKAALWSSLVLGLTVGVTGTHIYLQQDDLVMAAKSWQCPDIAVGYESNMPGSRSPKEYGVPSEAVTMRSRDGTLLKGFFMKQPDSTARPTVVFFPGRRGNVGRILSHLCNIYNKLKVNVLACDYRGFGASEGVASESAMYTDAEDIVCHLFHRYGQEIDTKKVVAWGWSLGSAPAAKLMGAPKCRERLSGLVVQSGLVNIWEAAAPTTPGMRDLVQWAYRTLAHSAYNAEAHIATVSKPTLVMCGDCDETTPIEMSERLFAACPAPRKEFGYIRGGTHQKSTFLEFPNVWAPIAKFVEETTSRSPHEPIDMDTPIITKWFAGAIPLNESDMTDIDKVGNLSVPDVTDYAVAPLPAVAPVPSAAEGDDVCA